MIQRRKQADIMQPKRADHWIKTLRVQANLRQTDLAVRLNVSPSSLRKWEHGEIEPSMTWDQWKAFSDAVGIPFDELPIAVSKSA